MLTFVIAILALVPMLVLLVVVHEWGHYFTARRFGIKVLEFGVGFPPRAFGFYTGGTSVILHPSAVYFNLEGRESLKKGMLVKLASAEGPEGTLISCIVEGPKSKEDRRREKSEPDDRSLKDRILYRRLSGAQLGPEEWLRHEGRIKSIDGDNMVVADMLYSVNWTPLGGFVRLAGENNPEVPGGLASKGCGPRSLVLAAGSLMNAILPIALFTILLMLPRNVEVGQVAVTDVADGSPAHVAGLVPGDIVIEAGGHDIENMNDIDRAVNLNGGSSMRWIVLRDGAEHALNVEPEFARPEGRWLTGITVGARSGRVIVASVSDGSPAAEAGILPGDVVASIGGAPIGTVDDLSAAIQSGQGAASEWEILRDGAASSVPVTPRYRQPEPEMWLVGISTQLVNSRVERRANPPWVALGQSFVKTWEVLVLIKQALGGAISQGAAPEVSGPVGIAQITGEVTREGGLQGWITVAILLSINLAIVNILPIPMLDGGRLAFVALEWVRRGKKVPPEKEGLVHMIGLVVLIGLIVLISANDIARLAQGQSFLG